MTHSSGCPEFLDGLRLKCHRRRMNPGSKDQGTLSPPKDFVEFFVDLVKCVAQDLAFQVDREVYVLRNVHLTIPERGHCEP